MTAIENNQGEETRKPFVTCTIAAISCLEHPSRLEPFYMMRHHMSEIYMYKSFILLHHYVRVYNSRKIKGKQESNS